MDEDTLLELTPEEVTVVRNVLAKLQSLNYYNIGRFSHIDEDRKIYTVNLPNGKVYFESILAES